MIGVALGLNLWFLVVGNSDIPNTFENKYFQDNKEQILIKYDQEMVYNSKSEISGFFVCFKKSVECDKGWMELGRNHVSIINDNSLKVKLPTSSIYQARKSLTISNFYKIILQHLTLSYIWRETPVTTQLGLPIYAKNGAKLPSPPWMKQICC